MKTCLSVHLNFPKWVDDLNYLHEADVIQRRDFGVIQGHPAIWPREPPKGTISGGECFAPCVGYPQCASAQRFNSRIVIFQKEKAMLIVILRNLAWWKIIYFSLIMEIHVEHREASKNLLRCLQWLLNITWRLLSYFWDHWFSACFRHL